MCVYIPPSEARGIRAIAAWFLKQRGPCGTHRSKSAWARIRLGMMAISSQSNDNFHLIGPESLPLPPLFCKSRMLSPKPHFQNEACSCVDYDVPILWASESPWNAKKGLRERQKWIPDFRSVLRPHESHGVRRNWYSEPKPHLWKIFSSSPWISFAKMPATNV